MTAQGILGRLQEMGVRVAVDGEKLKVTFKGELTPQVQPLLAELREQRAEVLAALASRQRAERQSQESFRNDYGAHEPDVLELVPLFSYRVRALFEERFRVRQAEGLQAYLARRTAAEDVFANQPVRRALYQQSWFWEKFVVPTGRGDEAWVWIHEKHGAEIRRTEAEVDAAAIAGIPKALERSCLAWTEAWRRAIEDWKANG